MKIHIMHLPLRRFCFAFSLASLAIVLAPTAFAQGESYPNKTIRFVVPYPAGGPLDQVARMIAEPLREALGQAVIVENRAGAGGNIGADNVAKSAADGYSIVMGAVATHAINPYLYKKMPYDANRDFTPITRVATVPNVLIMNTETAQRLGIHSLKDLLAYAKRNPGKLNYASGGNGSAGHMAGELMKSIGKVSMVHIPYPGAAPAVMGMIAGQTDLMFDNLASAAPRIKANQVKAFAVTTAQRSAFFPELPTMSEIGLPSFDINTWFGIFAPAKTPTAIVARLSAETTKILVSPHIKERMSKMGTEPAPLNPEAFSTFVQTEQSKYKALVQSSGAQVD